MTLKAIDEHSEDESCTDSSVEEESCTESSTEEVNKDIYNTVGSDNKPVNKGPMIIVDDQVSLVDKP
jgi:hypothetical protein